MYKQARSIHKKNELNIATKEASFIDVADPVTTCWLMATRAFKRNSGDSNVAIEPALY